MIAKLNFSFNSKIPKPIKMLSLSLPHTLRGHTPQDKTAPARVESGYCELVMAALFTAFWQPNIWKYGENDWK